MQGALSVTKTMLIEYRLLIHTISLMIQSDLDNPDFFNPEPLISDSVLQETDGSHCFCMR